MNIYRYVTQVIKCQLKNGKIVKLCEINTSSGGQGYRINSTIADKYSSEHIEGFDDYDYDENSKYYISIIDNDTIKDVLNGAKDKSLDKIFFYNKIDKNEIIKIFVSYEYEDYYGYIKTDECYKSFEITATEIKTIHKSK